MILILLSAAKAELCTIFAGWLEEDRICMLTHYSIIQKTVQRPS